MKNIDGDEIDLSQYSGKVVVVVNTASRCGLTPQYEQLQELYSSYGEQGVVVLGFPCNQFRQQEPGDEAAIKEFCQKNYGVTFDMFSKIEVNGTNRDELYEYLCSLDLAPAGAGDISWNFEKFIINKSGEPIARFGPRTRPDDADFMGVIEKALTEKGLEMPADESSVEIIRIDVPALVAGEAADRIESDLTAIEGLRSYDMDFEDKTITMEVPAGTDIDAVLNKLVEDGNKGLEGWTRR